MHSQPASSTYSREILRFKYAILECRTHGPDLIAARGRAGKAVGTPLCKIYITNQGDGQEDRR